MIALEHRDDVIRGQRQSVFGRKRGLRKVDFRGRRPTARVPPLTRQGFSNGTQKLRVLLTNFVGQLYN